MVTMQYLEYKDSGTWMKKFQPVFTDANSDRKEWKTLLNIFLEVFSFSFFKFLFTYTSLL